MFKHILIATDGSELSERAIRLGVDLAKAVGARVTAVMVIWHVPALYYDVAGMGIPNQQLAQNASEFATRCLAVASDAAALPASIAKRSAWRPPDPYQAIIDAATANRCDLIVMASHGRLRRLGHASRQRDEQGAHPLRRCRFSFLVEEITIFPRRSPQVRMHRAMCVRVAASSVKRTMGVAITLIVASERATSRRHFFAPVVPTRDGSLSPRKIVGVACTYSAASKGRAQLGTWGSGGSSVRSATHQLERVRRPPHPVV